jgi:nitroreductase
MLDLLKLIKKRQSSRVPFDSQKSISKLEIQKILEAGSWAPTAHNMQNFEVVVVDDKKLLEKIRNIEFPASETFIQENYLQLSFSEEDLKKKKTGVLASMFPKSWQTPNLLLERKGKSEDVHPSKDSHNQLLNCAALLIIVYNPAIRAPASPGDFLGIMSIGCVLENMWLMATELGIGFHVVSALSDSTAETTIKQMLNIPDHLKIAISFRLGYPLASSKYLRVRRDISAFARYNNFTNQEI